MNRRIILLLFATIASLSSIAQDVNIDNEYEKGQIHDGYKVGTWEYMGLDKKLELKINYDRGTLIFLKPDTSKYLVRIDSVWEYMNVSPHPRYIGSYAEFYKILASNLIYPTVARRKEIEKTVFLEFEVDPKGMAGNLRILNDKEGYFTDEIIAAFKQLPNLWLTANYNGQNVPAKFILPFYFKLTGEKHSMEYDRKTLSGLEGKKLHEMIVSAPRPK